MHVLLILKNETKKTKKTKTKTKQKKNRMDLIWQVK